MARQAKKQSEQLVLTDPKAYRVLAHGVRRQLLDVLGSQEQLTATEAARRIGVTPSAMSYHLRALQKWGIVERVDTAGDGREHPWRLTARSITIQTQGGPRDQRAFIAQFADQLTAAMTGASGKGGHVQVSTSTALMTPDEERELAEQIEKLFEQYERRRRPGADVPEGTRPHQLFFVATREPDA